MAIGNFDGVHLGHRAVISAGVARARAAGLAPVVLTFDPHPADVLGRGRPATLTRLERKIERLGELTPDLSVVVEPFTRELSLMTPRAFASELLVQALDARVVIVGENFRFGHGRAGDLATLRDLGAELGFEARAEDIAGDALGPYSSTRVRAALKAGDLVAARNVLGRPHAISGVVVHGDGRGRSIGVPTANLSDLVEALPPQGVYACRVTWPEGGRFGAVANLGVRPTVGAGFAFEVHLFDFDRDLYGQTLTVELLSRVRDERRFASLDALRSQIAADIAAARQIVASDGG